MGAVTDGLWRATHFINAGSTGLGWRLALRCGSVHGLSPGGAGRPGALHRSGRTAEEVKGSENKVILKTTKWISTKLDTTGLGPRQNPLNFGVDLDKVTDPRFFFDLIENSKNGRFFLPISIMQ